MNHTESDSAVSVARDIQIIVLVVIASVATCGILFIAYAVYRFGAASAALYEEFHAATGSLRTLVVRTRRGISWFGWGSDEDDHEDDKKWWISRKIDEIRGKDNEMQEAETGTTAAPAVAPAEPTSPSLMQRVKNVL